MNEKLSQNAATWQNILESLGGKAPQAVSLKEFQQMSLEQQSRALADFAHFDPGVYGEAAEIEWEVTELT
jgi:hypothetical protein